MQKKVLNSDKECAAKASVIGNYEYLKYMDCSDPIVQRQLIFDANSVNLSAIPPYKQVDLKSVFQEFSLMCQNYFPGKKHTLTVQIDETNSTIASITRLIDPEQDHQTLTLTLSKKLVSSQIHHTELLGILNHELNIHSAAKAETVFSGEDIDGGIVRPINLMGNTYDLGVKPNDDAQPDHVYGAQIGELPSQRAEAYLRHTVEAMKILFKEGIQPPPKRGRVVKSSDPFESLVSFGRIPKKRSDFPQWLIDKVAGLAEFYFFDIMRIYHENFHNAATRPTVVATLGTVMHNYPNQMLAEVNKSGEPDFIEFFNFILPDITSGVDSRFNTYILHAKHERDGGVFKLLQDRGAL